MFIKRVFDALLAAFGLQALALPLRVLVWQVRRKLGSPVFFRELRPAGTAGHSKFPTLPRSRNT